MPMLPLYVIPSLLSVVVLVGLGLFILTRNARSLINLSLAATLFGEAFMQLAQIFLAASAEESASSC